MDNMSFWHIRPRDPLVLGDGRPLDRQQGELWPIPATLAAAVNGWLAAAARARVKGLEKSSLRGPLLSWKGQLWVPGPMDARTKALSGEEPVAWVTGRLVPAGEHVLWPDGALSLSHLYLPTERSYLPTERSAGGDKLLELDLPVPWEAALSHALQQAPRAVPLPRLHETESRIHVSINGETGTALDGALFQTTGTRLLEDVTYVFGWDGPALRPGLVTFGGEGRMAHLDPAEGSVFPAFPRDRYTSAAPERGFLRVQLLTPGLFPDARPWAPADPDGLWLVGAATGPDRAFSGWPEAGRGGHRAIPGLLRVDAGPARRRDAGEPAPPRPPLRPGRVGVLVRRRPGPAARAGGARGARGGAVAQSHRRCEQSKRAPGLWAVPARLHRPGKRGQKCLIKRPCCGFTR